MKWRVKMVDTLQNKITVKPDKEYASCIKFFLKIISRNIIYNNILIWYILIGGDKIGKI